MYAIEWSEEAKMDIRRISAVHRGPIIAAIERLCSQAELEARNRRPLLQPLDELPEATWEVRIGDYRGLCRRIRAVCAPFIRVIFKGANTTSESAAVPDAVAPPRNVLLSVGLVRVSPHRPETDLLIHMPGVVVVGINDIPKRRSKKSKRTAGDSGRVTFAIEARPPTAAEWKSGRPERRCPVAQMLPESAAGRLGQ